MDATVRPNGTTLKVLGIVMGLIVLVAGWVYAGIMSGYTHRINTIEVNDKTQDMDIINLKILQARQDEQNKTIIEKLDKLIEKH